MKKIQKIEKKIYLKKETITRLNAVQLNNFKGGIGDVKEKSIGGVHAPGCGSHNTANGTCDSSCIGICC